MELPPLTTEPIRTQGHPDTPPFAVTRVSANAHDAYLALVTDSTLPADALVAITHQSEHGAKGPTYVMERHAGAWRFLVLDTRGAIQRDGAPECAGCHAGGVAEELFGPPRPKR